MALIIPVDSTGDRRIQVLLGNNLLFVRSYWNPTVPGWFMDLTGADGQAIALGLALVPAINALQSDLTLTRIYGQFRIFTVDGGENAADDTLGRTANLWWFAPGEWEANEIATELDTALPFDVRAMYPPPPPPVPPLIMNGTFVMNGIFAMNGTKFPA